MTPEPVINIDTQLGRIADDTGRLGELIGVPFPDWYHQCHSISLKLLRTGMFGPGRIARGHCAGIISQHSWIILGDDCYDPAATIVDPTLWSYDDSVDGIWVGPNMDRHLPHGAGSCFSVDMPQHHGGPDIELTPSQRLSVLARSFLENLEPLDYRGWGEVAHLPVGNWPAAEIIAAMDDTPQLRTLVPIDILGMITDRNPKGLYR